MKINGIIREIGDLKGKQLARTGKVYT